MTYLIISIYNLGSKVLVDKVVAQTQQERVQLTFNKDSKVQLNTESKIKDKSKEMTWMFLLEHALRRLLDILKKERKYHKMESGDWHSKQ